MYKGVVVDLLDEEIGHIGARDKPACPGAWIDQRAIGVRPRPIGQDHGTHDHPGELAKSRRRSKATKNLLARQSISGRIEENS